MPHLSAQGKQILSASEIATYVVCPQAWKLSHLDKVKVKNPTKSLEGTKDHQSWTESLVEAHFFTRAKYLIWILIGLLIVFYLIEVGIK